MFLRDTALYWNFIKENLLMKRLHCFLRKNNFLSLFSKIRVEHHFSFICLFWDSFQKIDVSWAKRFTFNIKLLGRSFTCIKNSNEPKIDPCSTPALISSQREFLPLSKTLWYLLPRKLWKSVGKLLETLLPPIYISNPHAKPYQKLLTYPKIRSAFPKTESYRKIRKTRVL